MPNVVGVFTNDFALSAMFWKSPTESLAAPALGFQSFTPEHSGLSSQVKKERTSSTRPIASEAISNPAPAISTAPPIKSCTPPNTPLRVPDKEPSTPPTNPSTKQTGTLITLLTESFKNPITISFSWENNFLKKHFIVSRIVPLVVLTNSLSFGKAISYTNLNPSLIFCSINCSTCSYTHLIPPAINSAPLSIRLSIFL